MRFNTLAEQVEDLKQYAANPQQRIRTGFDSLDFFIEGPAAGEVCTFIGRSYTGKSLLATNIMVNHPEKRSIFFSLEMPYRMAVTRMFSQWSGFDAERVRAAIKLNRIPTRITQMAEEMSQHVIIDKSGTNIGDMMASIEEYEQYFGALPDFVQIDYLERIGGIKSSAEGWQATEAAADMVKDLAKEFDLPVFLYHQTNRSEPEHIPPTERSARGGGYTEADQVVGLWSPARDPNMPPAQRRELWDIVRMNVLKNRPLGRHNEPWRPLEFKRLPNLRFRDLTDVTSRQDFAEQEQLLAEVAAQMGTLDEERAFRMEGR